MYETREWEESWGDWMDKPKHYFTHKINGSWELRAYSSEGQNSHIVYRHLRCGRQYLLWDNTRILNREQIKRLTCFYCKRSLKKKHLEEVNKIVTLYTIANL